jgi:hypothetical protein
MYRQLPGGSTFACQKGTDRETAVYLPRRGFGHFYNLAWNQETGKINIIDDVAKTDILCRSPKTEEQYWERPRPPEDWRRRRSAEMSIQMKDPEYYDPELEDYRDQEWHRREYGVWFMNNGEPVYLTGLHYFYLTHWKIDIGYPSFRIPDLEYFYFLQYCIEDPRSHGMVEMTKRRFGKTFRGGVFAYEYTSRNINAHTGIQSKTGRDARDKVYAEAILDPFTKLVDFMRPVIDQEMGPRPKSKMSFRKYSKKGAGSHDFEVIEGEELGGWIEPRSAKEDAFDGEKVHRYFHDECFKHEEEDIYQSHGTHKICVELDGQIIGKMLYSSTVEEINPKSKSANMSLWNGSSYLTRDPDTGQTITGLYQFFIEDYKTMNFDVYGHPDEEENRKYFDSKRNQYIKAGDWAGLASFIRKHPRTPEEAFWSTGEGCEFDSVRLRTCMTALEPLEHDGALWVRGDLRWFNNDISTMRVEFIEKRDGPFWIAMPPGAGEENGVNKLGTIYSPKNKLRYIIGVDPFDHDLKDLSEGSKPSKGAAVVMKKNALDDPDFNDNFVCIYVYRRRKSSQFYEDMAKLAVFYGAEILYESQKPGIKNWFEDNGMLPFLMKFDGKRYGIPQSPWLIKTITEHIDEVVTDNCERVVFRILLEDWHDFDQSDTRKSDLTMASGIALVGSRRILRRAAAASKSKSDISAYIRPVRSSGKRSMNGSTGGKVKIKNGHIISLQSD